MKRNLEVNKKMEKLKEDIDVFELLMYIIASSSEM